MAGRSLQRCDLKDQDYYVVYNDTTGTFCSPFFNSAAEGALYAEQNHSAWAGIQQNFSKWIQQVLDRPPRYQISDEIVKETLGIIALLKSGENLSTEQAATLENITVFVRRFIADSQEVFPEYKDGTLDRWIDELGITDQLEGSSALDYICDAQCSVYQSLAISSRSDELYKIPPALPHENIVVGRYLELQLEVFKRKLSEAETEVARVLATIFFAEEN